MLAKLNHKVMRLVRVSLGPVRLGRLVAGKSRPLTGHDLELLRRTAEQHSQQPVHRSARAAARSRPRAAAKP